MRLRAVVIVGAASPEGSIRRNQTLSYNRAKAIFGRISDNLNLPDSLMEFHYKGRDWVGLLKAVKADPAVPFKEESVRFIEEVIRKSVDGEREEDNNVKRLERLCGGLPYKYMYDNLFPGLRRSSVVLSYHQPVRIAVEHHIPVLSLAERPADLPERTVNFPVVMEEPEFYMALKTNMLYDAAIVPNLGAEFYLGHYLTLGGGWMHAWWSRRPADWFWRIYGGELYLRYWFGNLAKEKPLQGHHVGIHAQALTYDFEIGGRGYMGGLPSGTIFDKAHWGIGLEYGYSLPVAERLNIDFGITLGYLGGEYREYLPVDGHYVWQVTKYRNMFGPTKAEISLVWLLGRGNYNGRK